MRYLVTESGKSAGNPTKSLAKVNNMTTLRAGEQGDIPKRSERFFQKEGYWYYSTREGVDIGPFDSRREAETGAAEFIDFVCAAEPKMLEILGSYRAA